MELKDKSLTEKEDNLNTNRPILSSNVKDIIKRKKEEKNKKGMKKMNLISIVESDDNNEENSINDPDNENEDIKMIDDNEKNNKDNKILEKKMKENYKSIYSKHDNFDINFNANINKVVDNIKSNKKNTMNLCCKEAFILIINIISFILFYISCIKKSESNIIYYYFIYPISKISLILLFISSLLISFALILVKIKQVSIFHLFYSALFYMVTYFKYHLSITPNNISNNNYFDPSNCHFFIFFILMIHTLGLMFILYYICYYFYLNGQLSDSDSCITGLLVDYWESERKIKKLENYLKINLDQLITSKGHSQQEENIMNKKRNCRVIWRLIIIGFIILFVHGLLMLKKGEIFNCDYLNQGFNMNKNNVTNTPLDNDKYCKLPKVKGYCYLNALSGYFNIYDNLNNCSSNTNYKLEKINLINDLKNKFKNDKISENTKIFGYPLTNSKEFYFNEIEKNNINENNYNNKNRNMTQFEEKINKEIYDLGTNSNSKSEAILDYSDEKNPILKINIKYNDQLSKERKNIESNNSLFKNVFVVYLSGVSQFYFNKALPKLSSFINIFSQDNSKNDKSISLNSYQFTRFHSLSNDSFSNYFLMFNDDSSNSIKNLKYNLNYNDKLDINDHLKHFKDNGYITGQSIDTCDNFEHQIKNKNIFWDHENLAISCDPNYLNKTQSNDYCLYGNPYYSYHINYAMQFWQKYKNNKKYFRLIFNTPNEKYGSLLSYLDQPLYDLFVKLNFNGLLDDTAVFFISEFGGVQENILYNFGKYSEKEINMKFGSFFLLLNKKNKLNENEYKILFNNQNIMMTPYDIYASLVHISLGNKLNEMKLFIDENSKGESVFRNIEGNSRNCQFYKDVWIDEHFCSCIINDEK